jgi:hypothetical protein
MPECSVPADDSELAVGRKASWQSLSEFSTTLGGRSGGGDEMRSNTITFSALYIHREQIFNNFI